MANVVKLKRGSGSDPSASDMVVGEPVIRTDTAELFFKKDDGSVAKVSGGGGGPDFKYLELRNAANNGAASFPNADFTLVTSGTTTALTPTAANTLLVSVNGVIQKPNTGTSTPSSGFALSGSTIKFGGNISAAPDFILYQESGGIGEPSDATVSEAKLQVSNSPVNGYFLSAQSGNTGGLTWAAPVATSCTGNSATATALATARAINGVNFDGTAAITVTAAAGTLSGNTLNSSVVTSSLTSLGDLTGLTVNGNSSLRSILVQTDSTYDIGTTSTRYRNVYADAYYGDGSNLTGISSGVTSDAQGNTNAGTESGSGNSGYSSTFFGYRAGKEVSNATSVVAIGTEALRNVSTGGQNVGVGESALKACTTSNSNVAVGTHTLSSVSNEALGSTAIGHEALRNSVANYNTGIGYYAGRTCTTGTANFFGGKSAGFAVTTGSNNTFIGESAGHSGTNNLTTGSNNILIGHDAAASAATVSNEITLGDGNITKFRVPGLNFIVKDSTATNGHVLTVDANGEAGFAAAGAAGATGGGSDEVFVETGQTVTTSYTLSSNKNAVTVSPAINSGVTITVPSGATLVIL